MKTFHDIRDEEILLLGLCRLDFGIELKVMLQALAEQVTDWQYFAISANSHGVAALVYHNLEKLGFLKFLPTAQADFLRNAYLQSLHKNARGMRMLSEALEILEKNEIKPVLLKGMALEHMVYGNKGLRQMSDADILVDEKDCLRAYKILAGNGYNPLPVKSVIHRLILPYTGKHLPSLIKDGFSIEIHRELFGSGRNVLTRMLLESAKEKDTENGKVCVPEPQIFFLYLVKHLYLHELNNESQLRLYADLVCLIDKFGQEIINPELPVMANKAGMNEMLTWRLEPLRDLWGLSFPVWLNEYIDKWYNPASINKFVFFLKSPKNNPPANKDRVYRTIVGDIPGMHRKILFVIGDLFPTLAFMKRRYKCSTLRALFHYPHRLGKLLWLFRK